MDAKILLRRLVEMAGGANDRGYVLALASEGLTDVEPQLVTSAQTSYTVIQPASEVRLRHALRQANGAPVLALVDEPLARKLAPDLVRRAQGARIHAIEPAEVLSLALGVQVVAPDDRELESLALEHVDALRATIELRTLPTVVDQELLDELLLDVIAGQDLRRARAPELLARWIALPPAWKDVVRELVRRQLPRSAALEGRVLAWALSESPKWPSKARLEALVVYGTLLALDAVELPPTAWGPLLDVPGVPGVDLTPETFRQVVGSLARATLDQLGPNDVTRLLTTAEKHARKVLTTSLLESSLDLPLGLDSRLAALAQKASAGEPVGHDDVLRLRTHRSAAARRQDIAVVDEMARLSRYLATPPEPLGSTPDASAAHVRRYQREGAFADASMRDLRAALAGSMTHRAAALKLIDRVLERRNAENLAFAELLARGYTTAINVPGCVPLDRLFRNAPLRDQDQLAARIFLVVLDGCSYPIFLRLLGELANDPDPVGVRTDASGVAHGVPALALLPTITSHSRSAIFLGKVPGDPWIAETVWRDTKESATDPARFKQNAALGARSRRLFLKGDLADHGEALVNALRDPKLSVVAAVFNAVDDQIGSSNTGAFVSVRAAEVVGLWSSLRAALDSGRRVVVTADHGHTPFLGKELRVGEGSAPRHRALAAGESAPAGFLEIDDGGLGGAPGRKAFAWKMGAYQGLPQVGFHGGCGLEEMVVPLAELVRGGVAATEPAWWYGVSHHTDPSAAQPPPPPRPQPATASPAKVAVVQGDLFDQAELWATEVARLALPASLGDLDATEKRAIACIAKSGTVRVTDLAVVLGRPAPRTPGLMVKLIQRLTRASYPCIRQQTLPDGEIQYVYVPQEHTP